ncbi:MotE family protein [Paracerasibacillus soli]|uniref:Magnesium transporter MgtE intracellular domain-containing protein n=1 Tax=Paracerasibacillus soli TaxID=480284 RepID=A0ABU5CQL9_9BACI|nr:hypothetical protein [Virgibacillus soli]MDY0408161.1 hypothetical protein [Virgibacillus soli]
MEKLQKQLNESEDTIQSLKHKIAGIEKNTQQSTAIDTNEEIEMDTTEKFVGTFKNMDKAQAAQIIQSMDRDAAISVIAKMPNKTRGEILGAMDPKIAAEITEKLIGYKN